MNEDEYLRQIEALIQTGDWDGALQRIQSALDAYPHSATLWCLQGRIICDTTNEFDLEEAWESFQQAARYAPDDPQPHLEMGRFLLEVRGDMDAAEQAYHEAQTRGGDGVDQALERIQALRIQQDDH